MTAAELRDLLESRERGEAIILIKQDGRWPHEAREALKSVLWYGPIGYTWDTILDALAAIPEGDE